MRGGPETRELEELLRRRGTSAEGNARVEREIFERFTDECAVLVLDASGFTKLTQQYGIIHFLALVVAMRDLARPCLQQADAIAVWEEADNLFAVFHTADRAVGAALSIQEAVMAANAARPESDQLPVCIGVGFGRMLRIGEEDLFGDQMNLACKLGEDVAGPDEILLTEATWSAVKDRLQGLRAEPRSQRVSGVEIPYWAIHKNHS